MNFQPKSVAEIQSIVRQAACLRARGGGTKPALSDPLDGMDVIEIGGLSGILEYQPEEYTLTAWGGTKLAEVSSVLSQQGQYLPFDPPLGKRGATLGGTIAAGLSGPGRYRSGGARDFLLGARFVDGRGQLVSGGGKVVKNAAGFDLPKLVTGSLGAFGVLVELTFKVFPRPAAYLTLRYPCSQLDQALQMMDAASLAKVDLDALDLQSEQHAYVLWARLSGPENTLARRMARLEARLGEAEVLEDQADLSVWEAAREFAWVPDGWSLVKLPLTPGRIPKVDAALSNLGCLRRYSAGGQVAWVACNSSPKALENMLSVMGLDALVLWGPPGIVRLGEVKGNLFYEQIKSVFDPDRRFVEA
jgi:glycolate oxidase FAD binding subunit